MKWTVALRQDKSKTLYQLTIFKIFRLFNWGKSTKYNAVDDQSDTDDE